jgi:uncharacterized protein YegL
MKKNTKTYYLLILDKSGSMDNVISETVNGFNEQVQMIKNLKEKYPEQEIIVSLTTFNHYVDHDLFLTKPSQLKELKALRGRPTNRHGIAETVNFVYFPSGLTALYDAIGRSVNKLREKIKKEIKNNEASAVVVIITDGHENASREYSYEDIRQLIGKLEKSNNWTFSYLGATPDAVDIARGMNIASHNAMYYDKMKMQKVWKEDLNESMENYIKSKISGSVNKDFLKKKNN